MPDWFASLHSTPTSAVDAVSFFAEACRYTLNETLGRWRLADLVVGLAYISSRGGGGGGGGGGDASDATTTAGNHPTASVVAAGGSPAGAAGPEATCPLAAADLMARLAAVRRAMCYCRALRLRSAASQAAAFTSLGLDPGDVLAQAPTAGLVRPAYALLRDASLRRIVLVVRGTHSIRDVVTNLAASERPHHLLTTAPGGGGEGPVVLTGYAHHGMLVAARWLVREVGPALEAALAANPGFDLLVTGHSLGGGTAALAAMMLREDAASGRRAAALASASAIGIACPAVLTEELAAGCAPFVTSVVCGADLVPFISPAAVDALRSAVLASSWGASLAAEVRAHAAVRAVEAWVGAAGAAVAALVPAACAGAARPWRAAASAAVTVTTAAATATTTKKKKKPGSPKAAKAAAAEGGQTDGPAAASVSSAFASFACFRPRRLGAARPAATTGGGWVPVNARAGGAGGGGAGAGGGGGDAGRRPSSSGEEEDDDDEEENDAARRDLLTQAALSRAVSAEFDALAAALAAEEAEEDAGGRGAAASAAASSTAAAASAAAPAARNAHPPIQRQTFPAGRVMHLVPTPVFRRVRAASAGGAAPQPPPPPLTVTARTARPGDYTLLDRVPHAAYGAITLGGGLVAALREHFIPSYLGAFDAALPAVAERVAKVVATARAGGADV